MSRLAAGILLFIFTVSFPAAAEYNPPDGGEDILELASPLFLSRGGSVVSLESPEADMLNPAASALQQRKTLGLSYVGLADFAGDGWRGHGAFVGGTWPTRFGVFSGSTQFLHAPLPDMDLGSLGIFRFSFAKDLYPDLLVGSGVHVTVGEKDSFDIGLGADLGFIHLTEQTLGLRNFRWGAALRNMGRPYSPVDGRSGFPSPFTPAVGAAFTPLRSAGGVSLDLSLDAAFPAFQDLRLSLGADLSIKERLGLHSALRFDARQFLGDGLARRSLIPSFGLSVVFRTDFVGGGFLDEKGWSRSDVTARLAAAPLHKGLWAMGGGVTVNLGVMDTNPPTIHIGYPEDRYISPNMDGVSDALEFPVSIDDERYIREYRFMVLDQQGRTVRVMENKEKRPENESVQSVVDRLFAVKKGIDVPGTFRWDGIGDSGAPVPDGEYSFVVEARDDNGNLATSSPRKFVVDSTPPAVEVEIPRGSDLTFSPNDDGSKDTLMVRQTGSVEDLWTARFIDAAGQTVRTFTWENAAPADLAWDGKNDQGVLLPDGIYSYRIGSRDRAGNETSTGFDNIFINTEATPIALTIDQSFFSPNGDGVKDTVTLTPVIPITQGLESWELLVLDDRGTMMRRFFGLLNAPLPVRFDGKMEGGTILPEGSYTARLRVVYRNGNRPSAESPRFTVDLTRPEAFLRSDLSIFSPNGDGNKDEITFYQESSAEETWTGLVRNKDRRVVKTFSWVESADPAVVWNGIGDTGTLVPDGDYSYRLESVDRAGNRGESNEIAFSVNTEETPVILSFDHDAFSPNGDGVKDSIRFTPTVKVPEGVETVTLTIRGENEKEVRLFSGRWRVEDFYQWDGRDGSGARAPDGRYTAEIVVVYRNGNRSASRTGPFELDTAAPTVSAAAAGKMVFSPDGDGNLDSFAVSQTSSRENLWEGKISDSAGRTVRSFFWKGQAGDFTWDGADDMGNKVPDGLYTYSVRGEDRAGNTGQATLRGIRVDTRPASAFVTVDAPGFSPNGDGVRDETEFTVYLNMTDGIQGWRLRMVDAAGKTKRLFQGASLKSPMKVRWDGKGDDGSIVEGLYTAEFDASFEKGNRPGAKTGQFLLDLTPPEVALEMEPLPFSPDNDGVADELIISLAVRDAGAIAGWSLDISDRYGNPFNRFSGTGMPAETIRWDGRSATGELVIAAEDYPYIFTIADTLGNTRVLKGLIPVDILVIRDGDRLKIKISNITFAPNSPQVVLDDSDTGVKNRSVLKRLVEVLTKYGNYQILIEGHANNVTGTAREETEELGPLSRARAEEVKKALVERGLGARRIDVEGKGGTEMIFPFSDRVNNWKNRRVEFILVK